MKNELEAFLMECGLEYDTANTITNALTVVCMETHQYNRLVGILNEIRLANQEPEQDEQSGNST